MNEPQIYKDVVKVIERYDWAYKNSAIKHILSKFKEKKTDGILSVLRKHPNWDESRLLLELDGNVGRGFYHEAIDEFWNFIVSHGGYTAPQIKALFDRMNSQFLDESQKDAIEAVNALDSRLSIRTNGKVSKVISKLSTIFGWDKLDGYGKAFSLMCDGINPVTEHVHEYISLNPVDFLLMSNGDTWRSCHNIQEPGCHCAGTIGYMLDENSFVYYTTNDNSDVPAYYANGDVDTPYFKQKSLRQIFAYNNGHLLQSRLYPQSNDDYSSADLYANIRHKVQKIIAEAEGVPNNWIRTKKNLTSMVDNFDGISYPDWEDGNPGRSMTSISRLKEIAPAKLPKIIEAGGLPICIYCGKEHYSSESLLCPDCEGYDPD